MQQTLYPGVALIEGTNVSVGRGTDAPFQLVGAPWIKPTEFAAYLNARLISGVRFVPTQFTPSSGTNASKLCGGVQIMVVNREILDSPELGIELAAALRKLYPRRVRHIEDERAAGESGSVCGAAERAGSSANCGRLA